MLSRYCDLTDLSVEAIPDSKKEKNAIRITYASHTEKHPLKIFTETPEERNDWIKAINQAKADYLKNQVLLFFFIIL